jgi:hypothetical protein
MRLCFIVLRMLEDSNSNISNGNILEQDEVDKFINSTSKYVNLPKRDGESFVYQFFKDKTKRKLVTKLSQTRLHTNLRRHRQELSIA